MTKLMSKSMTKLMKVFKKFSVVRRRTDLNSNQHQQISIRDGDQAPIILGDVALKNLIENYSFRTVLDVGSGRGNQADVFERAGKIVTRFDNGKSKAYIPRSNTIVADFLSYRFEKTYDLVWACHVLEHQHNPNAFLTKVIESCKPDGTIAVTVPPAKPELVGGHLTLWTPGLLLYHLVLAGIDCKEAEVISYGYNISVIVGNTKANYSREILKYDYDDISRLKPFFPVYLEAGCRGDLAGNVITGSTNFWK